MIHKGRDKPHIYKWAGYWSAVWKGNPPYWQTKLAKELVDTLNREISQKAKTNEK